ncbi:MAG TPA: glycosyltransferase family 4 protein [Rhodocyclaceae bacterium]|nr:glycosyltransferase family 4 protein [Rhodocyclaceae bacterium]
MPLRPVAATRLISPWRRPSRRVATVLILGPSLSAISGVSTHLNQLLKSCLSQDFLLEHFQVGSEGRKEGRYGRIARYVLSPLHLGWRLLRGSAVVHINTSLNKAFWRDLAYLLVAKLFGAPVLYQVHGGALPQDFAPTRWGAWLLQRVLHLPDTIVVLARIELDAYMKFVPGQRVLALPNGVDCSPRARVARMPTPASMPLRLLYLGRLDRAKGLYEAVCGFWLARRRGVPARLTIAGEGPENESLRTLVRRLKLDDEVSFTGPVFGDDKEALFSTSDVLLLPSYAEGLPYALLEAMAAGVPPIATPVGAIPDVIQDGVHGCLVPLRRAKPIAHSITQLAEHRDQLAAMSNACRRRIVARYSSERVAEDFGRLYGEMGA